MTFTRVPGWYWADRTTPLVILTGFSVLIAVIGFMRDNVKGLDTASAVFSAIFLSVMFLAGILAFFFYPHPVRIEVDAKEVRVIYRPKKTIVIPRKDVIRATSRGTMPPGGRISGITYMKDGKLKGAKIDAWYRGPNGLLPRSDIITALNTLLKIDLNKAAVFEAKHRRWM